MHKSLFSNFTQISKDKNLNKKNFKTKQFIYMGAFE